MDFRKVNVFENVVVMIACYNMVGIGNDGTINKFVVVRINGDQIKAVSWLDENNERRNGEKSHQAISVFFAMKRVDNLPVFQHSRRRHTGKEISFQQILKYGVIRTGSGKCLDEDIRIDDDSQDADSPYG